MANIGDVSLYVFQQANSHPDCLVPRNLARGVFHIHRVVPAPCEARMVVLSNLIVLLQFGWLSMIAVRLVNCCVCKAP